MYSDCPMSLPDTYKAFFIQEAGNKCGLQEVPMQKPGRNQVLVKIAYAAVNPTDLMPKQQPCSAGSYRAGLEGSGIIVALGEDLKVPHMIGDQVHVTGTGTWAQYLIVESSRCRKMQEGLSLEEAAPHFIHPTTVVAMGDFAIKNGHKAIVHTVGCCDLGRMLIRYFKYKGIKTINIVRREEGIPELLKEGADYALYAHAPDFESQLREITHQENATLALEAILGEMTGKILKNLPDNSTVAVYGLLDDGEIAKLSAKHFILEGKTLKGFNTCKYITKLNLTGEAAPLIKEVYELLPTVLKTNIKGIFKLDDIKEAKAYYQKNCSKGKILIQPN